MTTARKRLRAWQFKRRPTEQKKQKQQDQQKQLAFCL
jgi:hypothetical protein